jgi:hypothetical protein
VKNLHIFAPPVVRVALVNVKLVKTPVEEVSATIDVDLTATAQIAGN